MARIQAGSEAEPRCEKCGSNAFLVDETCTHVEIDGEIVKTYPGDLCNRNCLRCANPTLYRELCGHEEERPDGRRHERTAGKRGCVGR